MSWESTSFIEVRWMGRWAAALAMGAATRERSEVAQRFLRTVLDGQHGQQGASGGDDGVERGHVDVAGLGNQPGHQQGSGAAEDRGGDVVAQAVGGLPNP